MTRPVAQTVHSEVAAEALEASIKHWQENLDAVLPMDASAHGKDCALCDAFFDTTGSDDEGSQVYFCFKCPVYKRTGKDNCGGSPWRNAYKALSKWRKTGDDTDWRENAAAELGFLKSLRMREYLTPLLKDEKP